jgi:hypothetical protein
VIVPKRHALLAYEMTDAQSQEAMLRIVEHYEFLAERVQDRAKCSSSRFTMFRTG